MAMNRAEWLKETRERIGNFKYITVSIFGDEHIVKGFDKLEDAKKEILIRSTRWKGLFIATDDLNIKASEVRNG